VIQIAYYACDFIVFVYRLCGVAGKLAARVAIALLVRKFSHVFPHELLKLVFRPGAKQPQSQVHVGKQSRKRSSRLQRVLRSFLYIDTDISVSQA